MDAYSDITIPLPPNVGDEIFWYAMQDDDNEAYFGSDRFFCLDTQAKFHYTLQSESEGCDNSVGFTRMRITGGYGNYAF